MRTVPCMAGCEGPMFRGIGSVGRSGASGSRSPASWIPITMRRLEATVSMLIGGSPSVDAAGLTAHQRLSLFLRVILAQRVADELRVHQQAPQIRVALEAHAVKIVGLALGPVGPRPQRHQGIDDRVLLGYAAVQAHAVLLGDRVKVNHHVEARL